MLSTTCQSTNCNVEQTAWRQASCTLCFRHAFAGNKESFRGNDDDSYNIRDDNDPMLSKAEENNAAVPFVLSLTLYSDLMIISSES